MKKGALEALGVIRDDVMKSDSGEEIVAKRFKTIERELTDEKYLELCRSNGFRPEDGVEIKEMDEFDPSLPVLEKDRIHTFRGSDETSDRAGDIIRGDGWKTDK